jgi:hypothetical protein
MPSKPSLQACRNTTAPSSSVCSLNTMPAGGRANSRARLALRSLSGLGRSSRCPPVLNVDLAPNAGYVLIFGPVLLLAGIRNHWGRLDWAIAEILFAGAFLSVLLLAPKGESDFLSRP